MMGNHVFVIAEAGSNWRMGTWDRDVQMGRSLIEVAAEAGADAVKFQTYRSHTVYVPNAGESDYLAEVGIQTSINDIFDDLAMPYELLGELAGYATTCGIEFMSTPFSVADAQAVDPFVKRHKVASYEINHLRLLEWLAGTGKPVILSTGAANLDDVDFALEVLGRSGGPPVTLLQCTSAYPAPAASLNLKAMGTLGQNEGVSIGLSDHSRDPVVAPVAAVALGATVIEKHFTLSNRLPGADHPFALEPHQLKEMVRAIRMAEEALGTGRKEVQPAEQELERFAVRAIQATCDIRPGQVLVEGENFDVLRPGKRTRGLHPSYLGWVDGRVAKQTISQGEGVTREAIE